MNTGGKTAALVGISAIGGILAYYGYSQYTSNDDVEIDFIYDAVTPPVPQTKDNADNIDNTTQTSTSTDSADNTDNTTQTSTDNEDAKDIVKRIKKKARIIEQKGSRLDTIKKMVENKDDKESWSEFWKGEYNKIKDEARENVEETPVVENPPVVEGPQNVEQPPVATAPPSNVEQPPVATESPSPEPVNFMINESILGPLN